MSRRRRSALPTRARSSRATRARSIRAGKNRLLLDLDIGVADDLSVALLLALQVRGHLVRRVPDRVETERDIALAQIRRLQRLLDIRGEAHEYFARRPGWRGIADPRGGVIAG